MAQRKKKETVAARIRQQAEEGRLADDVSIVYRVHGGSHGEHVDESIVLTAEGSVRVKVTDALDTQRSGEAREELGREEVLELARVLGPGIDDLVPESKARFVPDELVGSVTVGIGDESETYYFHADEDMYVHAGETVPTGVKAVRERFTSIEETCLARPSARRRARGKEEGR